MPNVAIRGVLARLCLGLAEVQPDAELLENYIANRDEAAFALLVQRHGPKVFAVCRRLLGQHQLAEDAYQATFVVLAKKAHTIQPRSAVGGFLYGVARKAALEAYTVSRRRKETLVETVPDSPAAPLAATDSDVLAMLDEEIANLSDTYRAAVVLCELDGVGRTEAAMQLGIAEGTLSSRLAAARKQLATRLKARGVVYSAGLMSSLAISANAAIPPTIASATTAVSLIVTGVLRTMLLAKFKLVTTVCILVSAIIGMSTFVPKASMAAKAAPVPQVEKDEGLLWMFHKKTSTLTAYRPDGKEAKTIAIQDGKHFLGFTEEGTKILFAGKDGKLAEPNATDGLTLHLRDVNDSVEGTDTGLAYQEYDGFVMSPDAKSIMRTRVKQADEANPEKKLRFSNVLFDRASKKETKFDLPEDHQVLHPFPDGSGWMVLQYNLGRDPKLPNYRRHKLSNNGKLKPVNDKYTFYGLSFSPDGKTLVGSGFRLPVKADEEVKFANYQVNASDFTVAELSQSNNGAGITGFCWSPNGDRLAKLNFQFKDNVSRHSQLTLYDADTKNPRVLFTIPDDGQQTNLLGWFPTKRELPKQKISAPVPKVAKDEGLLWMFEKKASTLTAYMPDGKVAKTIPLKDGKHFLGFTPDGTQILFAGKDGKLADPGATLGLTLHLRDVNDRVEGVDTGLGYQLADQFIVSPDMKKIVRSRTDALASIGGKNYPRGTNVLFDLATKTETPIDVPDDFQIVQWSADGKSWRAIQNNLGLDPKLPNYRWHTVPIAGGKPTPFNDNYTIFWLTPSPDGKTLLGTGYEHPVKLPAAIKWFNVTGEKATVTPVAQFEKVAFLLLRWSPDGRRVAYVKHEFDPETGITHDSTLFVCNPDGSDTRKLKRFENDNQNTTFLGWFPTKIELPKQPIAADLLVPKLGSGVFAEREAAQKELRALGLAALPALKAGLQSSDPEVVLRCETLIDRIGKDDAEAFAKAFLADKDYTKTFDHAIWTRWAKLIGDNRGSRELFAEMLSADGAAVALAYMADAKPKDAAERYRVELRKICSRIHPRTILSQSSTIAMSNRTLVGEASLAAYMGTYEGTGDAVKLRYDDSYPEFEYEADLLHTFCQMPWVQQGSVWPVGILDSSQPKPLEGESLKRGYRMQKPGWTLYVASLAVRMNPRSIQSGLQGFSGYKSELLDIAKAVIRNPKLPSTCRVMAIPILGECEAFDYLSDIAALQNDKTFVESGPQVNGRDVSVEVRDVSIAVQLLMHKQSLADFEFFVAKAADEQTRRFPTWQFIPKYHAFPDDASRTAAHVKALAFLKTAKKPESVKRMLSKLKATAAPEQAEMMLGEPISVTFTIANPTDQNWRVLVGGNDRNRLGRPNSFQVDVVGPDGKAVPQPDSGMDMGGITSSKPLPANGEYTFRLFLPHWATFAKTGDYTIAIRRKLQIVPDDNNHAFGPNANELDLSATTKIKVVAADAGQFGVLIAKFGKLAVDRESPERERATQMLRAIRDPRTVPYYIALSKQPHHEPRMTACQGLADYGTDEAFEALKAMTKTTGADLRGSATTVKLEESSAAGVRGSAVHAFGKNPHKDALSTLWTFSRDADYAIRITVLHKAAEIETAEATAIIETMTEDANATVRDEAKRYRSERAKRGK